MPNLVEQLHAAGKIPTENQCYTYVTLPIFAEGKYDIENLNPVPASEHFAMTGQLLNHLQGLKDGEAVNFSIVDWEIDSLLKAGDHKGAPTKLIFSTTPM